MNTSNPVAARRDPSAVNIAIPDSFHQSRNAFERKTAEQLQRVHNTHLEKQRAENHLWHGTIVHRKDHNVAQHVAKLATNAAYRRAARSFLSTGAKQLEEFAKKKPNRYLPTRLLVREDRDVPPWAEEAAAAGKLEVVTVSQGLMQSDDFPNNDGYIGDYTMPPLKAKAEYYTNSVAFKQVLVLDNVTDAALLGNMMRTAVAMAYDVVVMINHCADIYDPAAVRASRAALFQTATHFLVLRSEDGDDPFAFLNHLVERNELGCVCFAPPSPMRETNDGNATRRVTAPVLFSEGGDRADGEESTRDEMQPLTPLSLHAYAMKRFVRDLRKAESYYRADPYLWQSQLAASDSAVNSAASPPPNSAVTLVTSDQSAATSSKPGWRPPPPNKTPADLARRHMIIMGPDAHDTMVRHLARHLRAPVQPLLLTAPPAIATTSDTHSPPFVPPSRLPHAWSAAAATESAPEPRSRERVDPSLHLSSSSSSSTLAPLLAAARLAVGGGSKPTTQLMDIDNDVRSSPDQADEAIVVATQAALRTKEETLAGSFAIVMHQFRHSVIWDFTVPGEDHAMPDPSRVEIGASYLEPPQPNDDLDDIVERERAAMERKMQRRMLRYRVADADLWLHYEQGRITKQATGELMARDGGPDVSLHPLRHVDRKPVSLADPISDMAEGSVNRDTLRDVARWAETYRPPNLHRMTGHWRKRPAADSE